MQHAFSMSSWKLWLVSAVILSAFAWITSGPAIKNKLTMKPAESKCLKILEATAEAARMKNPDEHAKLIFKALATPDCRAMNDFAKKQ